MATLIGIDLAQYRAQAKDLLRLVRTADPEAIARVRQHHPEGEAVFARPIFRLADSQLVLAREQGFPSWPRLKEYLLFAQSVQALDSGDIPRLQALLDAHPALIRYRCHTGGWYENGYFAGATLLNHVAGNPARCPLPANILDTTRLLLQRGAGKDIPRARYTIGLILTSRQASEAHVALPLIDLIAEACQIPVDLSSDILDEPLGNQAPDTAREMIRRGARIAIRHAAALGRIDLLQQLLTPDPDTTLDPSLIPLPDSIPNRQAQLDQALLSACHCGQPEAADLLLQHGADPTSRAGGGQTGPHMAAHHAHLKTIQRLIERHVPLEVENEYGGTVLGQAVWSAINDPKPDHPAVIRALIAAGAKYDPTSIFAAAIADILN